MRQKKPLGLAVSAAMAAAAALATAPTFAQDEQLVEEVVVTGSRLTKSNISSSVPLVQISAEEISNRGVARIEDIVNILPNVFVSQTSEVANGATGTSTLNLRGLGAVRTLVLVDGKRLPFGSPFSSAANVDLVPSQLVERVDVITSGASAVYGSDAVAGVVNFITKKDFEGFQVDVQGGLSQNPNDNGFMADVLDRSGIANPGGNTGGEDVFVAALFGVNSSDGRGNVTAYMNYQRQEDIIGADRDTGACTLGGSTTIQCVGSSNFRRFNPSSSGVSPALFQEADGTLIPLDTSVVEQTYNFGERNFYQRPLERWNLNGSAHYELTNNVTAYMDFGYMSNNSAAQIAESASFNRAFQTNCDNPFLSAGRGPNGTGDFEFGDILGTGSNSQGTFTSCNEILADGNPDNDGVLVPFINSHRNVEGGPRVSTFENSTYRFVGGFKGTFAENFEWDVFGQYARNRGVRTSENDLNFNRVQQSFLVTQDANGNNVCQDTSGGCVPWNIYERTANGDSPITREQTDFIGALAIVTGETEQLVFGGTIQGELTSYGVKLPWADDGVTGLVGFEYREDSLNRLSDDISATIGGLTGTGGATLPIAGDIDVFEVFGEAELPLLQNAPFAKELGIRAGFRYSDYTTSGDDPINGQPTSSTFDAETWFVGASWTPIDDVRLRANLSRAIRAPNVFDLFVGANTGLIDLTSGENGLFDPCSGPNPAASLEACARTGVSAAAYGTIEDNPAGQFNSITGGNAQLGPETSDSTTFGVIFTPSFIEGLSVAIDYFDIEVNDAIGVIPAQASLDGCIAGGPGSNTFCSLIQRDTFNTLWLTNDAPGGGVAGISEQNANIALLETSGVDLDIKYSLDVGKFGFLSFDYVATFLDALDTTPFEGADPIECKDRYAGQCTLPNPEYRHRMLATWVTPVDLTVALTWRHVGETQLFGLDTEAAAQRPEQLNDNLEARDYLDLAFNYDLNDNINLRAGINNLLAEDPPLSTNVGTGTGNNNTYPGLFDVSRFMFVGMKVAF